MRIREWIERHATSAWHEDVWENPTKMGLYVHLRWCVFEPGMAHIKEGSVILMVVVEPGGAITRYTHENRNSCNFAMAWLERKLARQFGNWDHDNGMPKRVQLMAARKEEQHIPVTFLIMKKGRDLIPSVSYPNRPDQPEDRIANLVI